MRLMVLINSIKIGLITLILFCGTCFAHGSSHPVTCISYPDQLDKIVTCVKDGRLYSNNRYEQYYSDDNIKKRELAEKERLKNQPTNWFGYILFFCVVLLFAMIVLAFASSLHGDTND